MKRIALTDNSGNWFDADKAEMIKEDTYWDGHNWISKATGSQWQHECLFRTKGGKWVLNHYSDYQGSKETYITISDQRAAEWLAKQELDPHPHCTNEYNALEIL
jgi:hypothetical protein